MKYLIVILSCCLMSFTAVSANQKLPLTDYFSESWSTHNGLPHNSINAITQTPDGYLWIATWEGLARFNGLEFTIFTRSEINNLPDSGLRTLAVQTDGSLYIAGSRGGISQLKHHQWDTKKSAKSMVNHLHNQEGVGLWLAIENEGVFLRNETSEGDVEIISNVSAYRIVEDNNNVIWVATSAGLYKIVDKQATLIGLESGLPNASVYTLLLNRKGQLIVGSEQGAWKLEHGYFKTVHSTLNQESISSLLEDHNGDLWLGTINKGIFRVANNSVEQLNAEQGLPANRILSLYQDRENSIWVGTNAGIYRLREAPFSSWTSKRGLAGNYIRTVLSHSDGSLWVGGSSGLNRIVNKKIHTYTLPNNRSTLSVLSLYEDLNGEVWVGTYTAGLFKVQGDHVVPVLNRSNGLNSNEVRALFLDSQQRLWIGTAAGVTRINADGSLMQFSSHYDLQSRFILAISEDKSGNIWIGSGKGVAKFDNSLHTIEVINFPQELGAQYAFGFYMEQDYVWMATDRGLVRYNQASAQMHIFGKQHGLPVDKLFQVVAHNSAFWLPSNRGIIKVNKEQVNAVLDAKVDTPAVYQLFDEGDGMLSAQANGGSTPSATLHKDGTIWFATAEGVAMVMPSRLEQAKQVALPTVIESFMVDGQTILMPQTDKTVVLAPDISRISFHYAGLSFIMPQRLVFQTKLEGFSDEWVNRYQVNSAEYTNLPPGKYTFMVRAGYPNGQWQNNQQVINFEIKAYLWQKWYFQLAAFCLFIVFIYLLYRYRLYHFKKIELELISRVKQQTTDLQKQADAFAYQATHDQLTQLPNRRAFDGWVAEHFDEYKNSNNVLSVAILDIDHFKKINDGWSHLVGDKVICIIAELLKQRCDNLNEIARWGGEEFTLLFPNKSAEQAKLECELLRQDIATYDFNDIAPGLIVTASFGVCESRGIDDYDKLLSSADQALYQAKNNGRNRTELFSSVK